MIGRVPNAFRNDLCELVVFRALKGLIVDFGQFCVSDSKTNCVSKSETSILG